MWCQFWVSLRLVLVSVLNDLDHSLMGHVAWRKPGAMLWGSPKERLTWWGSSVQFSYSVVSNSLWPHGLQHTRTPCLSPTPGVYPNSCPLSWWCHPTISSSVIPFFSCLQSFPASGSFPMSQVFASGGQSTGVSALASFLPKKSKTLFFWAPKSLQKVTAAMKLKDAYSLVEKLWPI